MKNKIYLIALLFLVPAITFSQGKNISFSKKSEAPYVTLNKDTLKTNQQVIIATGSNQDGSFKYVHMINNFGEPVKPADSRAAMKKQEIKFFKEQDGTTYLFTKYFVVNVEAALAVKELIIK